MTTNKSAVSTNSFAQRMQSAGMELGDSEELRLNKSLLMLATGLICVARMVWAVLYSLLNVRFSINVTVLCLVLLAGNMFLFLGSNRFDFFRVSQLGLFLFLPFVL